jgi:hypothetical protein
MRFVPADFCAAIAGPGRWSLDGHRDVDEDLVSNFYAPSLWRIEGLHFAS